MVISCPERQARERGFIKRSTRRVRTIQDAPTNGVRAPSRARARGHLHRYFPQKIYLRKIQLFVFHKASTMPDTDLSSYLAWLIASAHRQMKLSLAQLTAEEGVNEEHWRILHAVSDEAGHSMSELAAQVLLNLPALTKNVDKLVSRGLVQRSADDYDSRKVLIFITDRGIKLLGRLQPGVDAHHAAIEEALGPRNAKQLKRLLERFIEESGPR
jgi:DNA-binding MarR family transcriptional regulator